MIFERSVREKTERLSRRRVVFPFSLSRFQLLISAGYGRFNVSPGKIILRYKTVLLIAVAVVMAFIGTPRSGSFGMPIGSPYHDYLFFAEVLDHREEFAGTVFLDMANRLSSTTILVNIVRLFNGYGFSYDLQAAFFAFIGNVAAVIAVLYCSFLLTRSIVFPLVALLSVWDLNVLFKFHILSSSLASQFGLLTLALLLGGRYRLAGAAAGVVGFAHPITPLVLFSFAAVFSASCGNIRLWLIRMRSFVMTMLLVSLPYILLLLASGYGGELTASADAAEWSNFIRGMNQLPFIAMNMQKFIFVCAFLASAGGAFLLAGIINCKFTIVSDKAEEYRGISFVFLISLVFVIIQAIFTEIFQTVTFIKLCLHHRLLPIVIPLMIVAVVSLCFEKLLSHARLPWFLLLVFVLLLPTTGDTAEWWQLVTICVGAFLLLSAEYIAMYRYFFDRMARSIFFNREIVNTPLVLGILLLAFFMKEIPAVYWVVESSRDWKKLVDGTLSEEKFPFRSAFVKFIAPGERVIVSPLRDGQISKFLTFAPLRANFIEHVELSYLLYSPSLLPYVQRKLAVYGSVDWKAEPLSVAKQYGDLSHDGWNVRNNIDFIQKIDQNVKFFLTQRQYTCDGESFLKEQQNSSGPAATDIVLLRLSDVIDMKSCKKWQIPPPIQ